MKNSDECVELKNIKYKTMLMNNIQSTKEPRVTNIESFLEKEKTISKSQHWSKLSKLTKKNKLIQYCDNYSQKNNYTEDETKELVDFLLKALDRKKLQRVKDVIYDVETQSIINIPALSINKTTKKYTIKSLDKKVSTLKSLAPRKGKKVKDKEKKKNKDKEKNKDKKEKNKNKEKNKDKKEKNKEKKDKDTA
jgi:hypothetical protein